MTTITATPTYHQKDPALYHSKETATKRADRTAEAAEHYINIGWVIVKAHAPIFSTSGRVGCTCEEYYRSDKCRDDGNHKYNPDYICPNPGKHPYGKWRDVTEVMSLKKAMAIFGRPQRVLDVDTGQMVYVAWNIGILTGPSNVLTLDADTYKKYYQCDLSELIPMEDQETPQQFSQSGGLHLVFDRENKPYTNANGELKAAGIDGVDIRGDGGFQVVEPSLGPSGNEYAWIEGFEPWTVALRPIPAELDRILAMSVGKSGNPAQPVEFTAPTTDKPDLAQWHLSHTVLDLLHNPPPKGKRSEADQKVITALVRAGATNNAILAFFEHFPLGTHGRFAEKGRDYLARSIGNARKYVEDHPIVNDGSVDDMASNNGFGRAPSVNLNGAAYVNGHSSATATQAAKLVMSPGRRIKHTKNGVTRIVKIVALNTILTVDGGPNVYDGEYTDAGANWPILVSDDDEITLMDAATTAQSTTQGATTQPLVLDDVLAAIKAIADNAELKPHERKERIIKGLSHAIGNLKRGDAALITDALMQANAGLKQTAAQRFVDGCFSDAKKARKAEKAAKQAKTISDIRQNRTKIAINISNQQMDTLVQESLLAILSNNMNNPTNPIIYSQNGKLVRVVRAGDGYILLLVENEQMLSIMSRIADWTQEMTDADGNEVILNTFPPNQLVKTFLGEGEWPGLYEIYGITNCPTFAPDGALHSVFGYSPKTHMFYTGGVTLGDTTPTPENIAAAKSLLFDDLFVDFPFDGEASKAHLVALAIQPLVRGMIDGPTPLHLVDAPMPGSGKGLAVAAALIPALGKEPVSYPGKGENDEEWRKQLTSCLVGGTPAVVFDNLTGILNAPALAIALTETVYGDRILGVTGNAQIPVRVTWAATANNVSLGDDIIRRTVWTRLDANQEDPSKRTGFKHENLKVWAKQNRDALLTALVTLVNKWIADGMPAYKGRAKGSYEAWCNVIGGILQSAGIDGFLANDDDLRKVAFNQGDAIGEFVEEWARQFGETRVTTTDLFPLASHNEDIRWDEGDPLHPKLQPDHLNLLGDLLGSKKPQGRKTALGMLLGQQLRDRVIRGFKVLPAGMLKGSNTYMLKEVIEGSLAKALANANADDTSADGGELLA